jgi:hypothetical protein
VIVGALHISETLAKFEEDAVAIAFVILWKFVVAVFDAVAAVAEIAPLILGVTRNVYVVPASRPVTVAVVPVESGRTKVVQVFPSLLDSTR